MIRRAIQKDKPMLHELLTQVLEIHADIRPDIFISGTTKYTDDELQEIIEDDTRPIFVAVDDQDEVLGYCFTMFQEIPATNNTYAMKSLYIDDLCVSEKARGQKIGKKLADFVMQFARENGCTDVTLNVWQGNDSAYHFYENYGFQTRKTMMEIKIK